jgi:hypothetical protein
MKWHFLVRLIKRLLCQHHSFDYLVYSTSTSFMLRAGLCCSAICTSKRSQQKASQFSQGLEAIWSLVAFCIHKLQYHISYRTIHTSPHRSALTSSHANRHNHSIHAVPRSNFLEYNHLFASPNSIIQIHFIPALSHLRKTTRSKTISQFQDPQARISYQPEKERCVTFASKRSWV